MHLRERKESAGKEREGMLRDRGIKEERGGKREAR